MGKYIGSVCRLCRREGEKLFLKGTRCTTHRCAIERRAYAPGQHGESKRVKLSNFGLQLREKQKVKRIYGLFERQFRKYFHDAAQRKGVTGTTLLQTLERRLDNVIFQLGFCTSRKQARQFVGHGYVYVNEHRVNIPSYQVKVNDEIQLRFKNKGQTTVKENLKVTEGRTVPQWLQVDTAHYTARVTRLPEREDIQQPINEQLIVELYSR
jgi:small subunit ribosomal protein S4